MIIIRAATLQDAAALTEILRSVEYFTRLSENPFETVLAQVTQALLQDLAHPNHLVLLAEDENGRALGYVAVHWLPYLILDGPEGYVSELFVHSSARAQGVGSLLLEAVTAEGQKRGCSRLSLLNGRQRESYRREFYKKHGWREREVMANFIYELKPK